ncbi:benzoylformate decarboxylase [Actinomycetospora endophytica]|uniref:Benzoylformate decarboxylase n=1 Tax=Actinomycetospora endophytica TaxID=2291215 RepID=A0ABS8P6M7_9PSEU|nr:benzoylformate decarboxylase [Actinomycetospora endophytica]MCD2193902.1 benzoylformate decarboxylase [Actinomycetospora endophytica]
MVTVREMALELFRAHGMTTVFGNPGSTELPMLQQFPDDFRYVLGLQEAVVVGMADGYAQASGRPTLVNLHTAPGVGNAVGALVNAAANKTPLVVTAGQQVRPMLALEAMLTNPRATELPRPTVKFSGEPARAADVPALLARAIHAATTPPTGPVFVSIPMDDWDVELTGPDLEVAQRAVRRSVRAPLLPDESGLGTLVAALDGATAPALVVGGDVDAGGGFDDAVALAERCSAAVYGPPVDGRVAFPEDHPLFRGALPMAIAPLAQTLEPHDVVVVLGTAVFRYYPYVPGRFLPDGTELHHVTADPDEAARAPMGDALIADPTTVVRALRDRVAASSRPVPGSAPTAEAAPVSATPGTLTAEEVFDVLGAVWPADGVVVDESPSNRAALHARRPVRRPASSFFTTSGGLGFGLPAAVGVALADPSRPVLAAIGDGSMQYAIQALATASALAVPVTVMVLENHEYAILKWFAARENTPKAPGLDLPPVDFTALAAGYGVPAERVSTVDELRAALERGRDADGPRLVSVPLGRPSG